MNTFSNFWLYLNSDYMNSNQTTAFSCRFSYIILQKSADHSRSTLRKQRQALAWFGFWSSARPLTVIDICQLISSKVLVLLHTLRLNLTLSSHIVFCYTGYVSTSYWAPILCFATHVTFQPHTELPYRVFVTVFRMFNIHPERHQNISQLCSVPSASWETADIQKYYATCY